MAAVVRRLLLADDSVTIQKVVELTFSDEGLRVITVGDGERAIEILHEIKPDIVLADIHMPRRSGYEVCEYIKRNEAFRHVPVMLLVGSFEPFDEAEARRVGADEILTKPFQSIRQLVNKVGTLLGRAESGDDDEGTTRELVPPPEKPHEEPATLSTDVLEVTTADTAPLPQSLTDEKARDLGTRPADAFVGVELDDATIEAIPASHFGSASNFGHDAQMFVTAPAASTVADSYEESRESTTQAPEPEPQLQLEPQNTSFDMEENNQDTFAATPFQTTPQAAYAPTANEMDDALLDLGDIEQAGSVDEGDSILDLWDDTPAQETAAEESLNEESAVIEDEMFETAPHVSEFVEGEVVNEARAETEPVDIHAPTGNLPAIEDFRARAYELESGLARHAQEDSMFDAPTEAPERSAAMASAESRALQSASGQITLAQLSPEVIDAIARRAVEMLSDRVVREIAWEVVPELAELHIKRRLEEERTRTQ